MNNIFKIRNNHLHVFPWLSNFYFSLANVFGFCFDRHVTTWISSLKISHIVFYKNNDNSKINLNLQNKTKYFYFKTLYLSIESIKLYRWGWGSIYIVWMAVKTTHAKMISFSEVIISKWHHHKWWQLICLKKTFFNISIMQVVWQFSIFLSFSDASVINYHYNHFYF